MRSPDHVFAKPIFNAVDQGKPGDVSRAGDLCVTGHQQLAYVLADNERGNDDFAGDIQCRHQSEPETTAGQGSDHTPDHEHCLDLYLY